MSKTLREAAQQALDELDHGLQFGSVTRAKSILRAALVAEGEVQPICYLWIDPKTRTYEVDRCTHPISELIPVYTTPQPAKREQAAQPTPALQASSRITLADPTDYFTADQMRDYLDADRAHRHAVLTDEQKDAARYRWLRQLPYWPEENMLWDEDRMDAEIDAAIAADRAARGGAA